MTKSVLVIGGGPAGMLAAIAACERGAEVTVIEKNKMLGRKLSITGKGRCNITNACGIREIIENTPHNGTFLHSALHNLSPDDVMAFFTALGVELKIERGRRVFPVSDKATDIVNALSHRVKKAGVDIRHDERIKNLLIKDGKVYGAECQDKNFLADAVILATGGASYPATGSTGDGYRLAAEAGHNIFPPIPSLVPLDTREEWVSELSGLSLKNISLEAVYKEKVIGKEFGEMLFTHTGVSGPVVLSVSHAVSRLPKEEIPKVKLVINLKPALSAEQLSARIQRDLDKFSRKHFVNSLPELLPSSLIPVLVRLSGIPPHKESNQITKQERERLVGLISALTLTVSSLRPLDEAIVTAGGVDVKEVDPKTMQSKLIEGLYFAGELLDIDAYTGGYNLQMAFSTGWTAGMSAALR